MKSKGEHRNYIPVHLPSKYIPNQTVLLYFSTRNLSRIPDKCPRIISLLCYEYFDTRKRIKFVNKAVYCRRLFSENFLVANTLNACIYNIVHGEYDSLPYRGEPISILYEKKKNHFPATKDIIIIIAIGMNNNSRSFE